MLFLPGFLRRRRPPAAPTQPPRCVFAFTVAGERRVVDPMVAQRALEKAGGEHWLTLLQMVARLAKPPSAAEATLLATPADWQRRNRDRLGAIENLATIAREAFGLAAVGPDGAGVTEEEAINVLGDFLEFTEGLAEQARPFAS